MPDKNLEIKAALQEKDITFIKGKMKQNDSDHKALFDELRDVKILISELPEKLEKKFSGKWVEKGFIWGVSTVLLIVITAIVGTVIVN